MWACTLCPKPPAVTVPQSLLMASRLTQWVFSFNRWPVVSTDRKSCATTDRMFLTPWDLASTMLSVRLSWLLSPPPAQPLTWTYNLLSQHFDFAPPSGCIWSQESQKVQLGYPKIFKQVVKSVSSFSISLPITWGQTTQYLWKEGYQGFGRQGLEDPTVQLTSSNTVCFTVVKQ